MTNSKSDSAVGRSLNAFGLSFSLIAISFLGMFFAVSHTSMNVFAVSWSTEEEISQDFGTELQINPAIAIDGDEIHVAWTYQRGPDSDVYYRHYDGTAWEPQLEISSDLSITKDQFNPAIAAQGGKVHVVWEESTPGDDSDIYYRYFDGSVWQPDQQISFDSGFEDQYEPAVAVNGSKVHVVWVDWGGGQGDIFYRLFDGTTWQTIQEISQDTLSESQMAPSIAVQGEEVHVAWEVMGMISAINYTHFNGTDWEPIENIGIDLAGDFEFYTSIAVDNDGVHVVWKDLDFSLTEKHIKYRHHNETMWEDEQDITPTGPADNTDPSIVSSGGLLHATWVCAQKICYMHHNGTAWKPSQVVSIDLGLPAHQQPAVAANGPNAYPIWSDMEDGDFDIYLREFNGTSWQTIEEISEDIIQENQFHPVVAAENDKVHVIWEDDAEMSHDLFYVYDEGLGWEPEQELNSEVSYSHQWAPAMDTDGNNVNFVWMNYTGDRDVYYRGFNGITWTPDTDISGDVTAEDQNNPSIASESAYIHVVWQEIDQVGGDSDIYYTWFDGIGWQPPYELSTDTGTEDQFKPAITMEGNQLHVVWQDYEDGDSDIYYRHFNGVTWDPEQEISVDDGSEDQLDPCIDADGGKLHLAWEDWGDGDGDIYYRYFDGLAWDSPMEISTDALAERQMNASIAAENGTVHVTWTDMRGGDGDIFYTYAAGGAWQPIEEISQDTINQEHRNSSVAIDNGILHIVWEDWGGLGDGDIFYRRGVVGTSPPTSSALTITPYWNRISPILIDWTATDDLGLGNISLYYRYSLDNFSWSGWREWDYDDTISGTPATGNFSFSMPDGEGYYEFYTLAQDAMGNWEASPPSKDTICGYDATEPIANADPIYPYHQTSSPITVNVTASDNLSGVEWVSLGYVHSEDNITWIPGAYLPPDYTYPYSFSFGFPSGEGHYRIWATATDYAGNTESGPAIPDTIVVYATPTSPPANVQASLFGPNHEDVRISWDLSPDDGMGKDNVVWYNIFRGTSYDSIGSSYPFHDSVPAGTTGYTDVKAGDGDPANYFYVVCAANAANVSYCDSGQVGKFTRQLSAGVNLVSVPLVQSDESIGIVLQTIAFEKAWTYNSSTGGWKSFASFKPYQGELDRINHSTSVWVDVTSDCNITAAGVVPETTLIQLYAGWNLIGFPSFNSTYTVSDLKTAVSSSNVEEYDPLAPYHLSVVADPEVLQAGYGYWVWVDAEAVLNVTQ